MINLYRGLKKGWTKSKALQEAKLEYLNTASPTFRDPHFWAGYQLTGDIEPLTNSRSFIIISVFVLLLFSGSIFIIRNKN
jgi:hypothetical protein